MLLGADLHHHPERLDPYSFLTERLLLQCQYPIARVRYKNPAKMKSHQVIAATTHAMREVLWGSFDRDPTIRQLIPAKSAIVFVNPAETVGDPGKRLSIWCYRITERSSHRYIPSTPGATPGPDRRRPLSLELDYLMTPFTPSDTGDQLVLGKIVQTLRDNSVVPIQDNAVRIAEPLRITLCKTTLEELTRLWQAQREPFRLSLSYRVQVTTIDSQPEDTS